MERTKGGGSVTLQKKLAEARRPVRAEPVPDLTDFMNDMFFGVVNGEKKAYNLTGKFGRTTGETTAEDDDEDDDFDSSTRSVSSRLTQEWLEEAKRMVASSPSRCESPSRLVGSPRFAVAANGRVQAAVALDRRDPLSRSARRHRAVEGFSGEIISKSASHTLNRSATLDKPDLPAEISPASAVHKWFSNILKPPNSTPTPPSSDPTPPSPTSPTLPPRQSTPRKSRFQNVHNATQPQTVPTPTATSRRTFATPAQPPETRLLSPPKHLIESAHRRSVSSSTCSAPNTQKVLSPPRNLVESANRRSISCSADKIHTKVNGNSQLEAANLGTEDLNGFLKEQRVKIGQILSGEINGKAKIVLSGPTNSTSSMVAAICYAWLLENKTRKNKEGDDGDRNSAAETTVVPVMNMKREKMWKQQQAAWIFHHVGVDATALLFSDEVDLEMLMMNKHLSILIVGQDILKNNGEVGSRCTILTDNYCEDAYDLLHSPVLKKLLLAGILLDTHNLKPSPRVLMTRDSEAVQLLSVGSAPNFRNVLYDQLMRDHRDDHFFEALRQNYGKPPNEGIHEENTNSNKNFDGVKNEKAKKVSPKSVEAKRTPSSSPPVAAPAPARAPAPAAGPSRKKNTFFLAKWLGIGK